VTKARNMIGWSSGFVFCTIGGSICWGRFSLRRGDMGLNVLKRHIDIGG